MDGALNSIVPQMSKVALDGAINDDRAGLTARTV